MNILFHLGRLANGVTRALEPTYGSGRGAQGRAGEECTPCAANAYAEQQAAEAAKMLGRSSSAKGGRGGRGNGRGAR